MNDVQPRATNDSKRGGDTVNEQCGAVLPGRARQHAFEKATHSVVFDAENRDLNVELAGVIDNVTAR